MGKENKKLFNELLPLVLHFLCSDCYWENNVLLIQLLTFWHKST